MATLVALGGCAGATDGVKAQPTPCPSITGTFKNESLIPNDLPIELFGDIVATHVGKGFLTVDSLSTTQIIELDPLLQRDLIAHGYQIVSHDNEGFEAEIFFARGSRTTGIFSLHNNPCRKRIVRVKLVYTSKRFEEV
jgi:hypothetical protein